MTKIFPDIPCVKTYSILNKLNWWSMISTHRRRNRGSQGGMAPPIFYPRDFINIHTCSTDRHDRSVYYVRPPKNVIASYAYGTVLTLPNKTQPTKLTFRPRKVECCFCVIVCNMRDCWLVQQKCAVSKHIYTEQRL